MESTCTQVPLNQATHYLSNCVLSISETFLKARGWVANKQAPIVKRKTRMRKKVKRRYFKKPLAFVFPHIFEVETCKGR